PPRFPTLSLHDALPILDCCTPFGSRCPKCSVENPVGKKFCGDCGTALVNKASIVIATTHTIETPAPEIRMRPEQGDASATANGEDRKSTRLNSSHLVIS